MLRSSASSSFAMSLARHTVSQRQLIGAPAWLQNFASDESNGSKLYAWKSDNLEGYAEKPGGDLDGVTKTRTLADSRKRIHILGVGNLGRLYATSLSEMKRSPITLVLHRKELLEQWTSRPAIEISRRGVTEKVSNFDVEWWTEERPRVGPVREVCDGSSISNLIVATKAPDALPQVDRLRRYLDASSTVAFVQNGMNRLWPPHGAVYNGKRFPPNQHPNWIHCVTTHGVTSLGPFRSIHASPADIAMGPVFMNPETQGSSGYLVEQILQAPHLSARAVPSFDLWVLQLEKLVVNSTINPMTALLRCKNGLLFSSSGDSSSERVMDLLLDEASLVLRTLVLDDSSREILAGAGCSSSNEKVDVDRQALVDRFSSGRLKEMLRQVGEKVKDNTSSMLQDVTFGKETEIKEFNGWFVDTAEYLGVKAPNHRTICNMVEESLVLDQDQLGRYFPAINDM
ncbi:Ketopantoate reductase PanE/ApbA C terminal domain containing protein [Naviculisporaceae sp. PSN 640]